MTYDSRVETYAHIVRVTELVNRVATAILVRGPRHDRSKLEPPEVETFDRYTPRLRDLTYGTAAYRETLAEMGPALDRHYRSNRHHPEHFADGIAGMTLVDVVEMLADWKAASERHADGDFATSIDVSVRRFGIEPQLAAILRNTAESLGWLLRPDPHRHP